MCTVDTRRMTDFGRDHTLAVEQFDAAFALKFLQMDSEGHVNAAEVCCDRHVRDGKRVALHHRAPNGKTQQWTFAELQKRSSQFSRTLAKLGVSKGDRVASLLPRTPELLVTILATWRLGAVYQPLFTAFGPKAIEHRLKIGGARVIVTDAANRTKMDGLEVEIATITVGAKPGTRDCDFWSVLKDEDEIEKPVPCTKDDPFLMMFTSGTTGLPKPLYVPHRAIAAFVGYLRDAVGLHEDDRFWNFADPGWAYGLYYAVVGPLAMGVATVLHEGNFNVDSTYATLADLRITHLAGSPSAYRLLAADGSEKAAHVKGQLRAVSSAGEPLNEDLIRWFDRHLDTTIHDHYGATEFGIVLCNHHGLAHPLRMGSAGYAMPGHRVVVLSPGGEELGASQTGELALDLARSPMMWFKGYHEIETPALRGGYLRSGDMAELNEDGSISFVGRADDVITTSGYRVGPFDVESALNEHDAVLESAVIGRPDPHRTEIIKAFVVLKAGHEPEPVLAEALRQYVRSRLSAHAYPREIEFVEELPKTPSGKIQRFQLRNRENTRLRND